jgi:hypothetical protein
MERTLSLFRVAVLQIAAGSMSKPTSAFTFTTYAPRTGEIGCLTKRVPGGCARRYVEPNQCFKLIIAFVAHPRVTNVIALEKFRICGRAQEFATFWAGGPPEIPFINIALGRSEVSRHIEHFCVLIWNLAPATVIVALAAFKVLNDIQRILLVTKVKAGRVAGHRASPSLKLRSIHPVSTFQSDS